MGFPSMTDLPYTEVPPVNILLPTYTEPPIYFQYTRSHQSPGI